MKIYSLGLDFGTNSCRSLIVDMNNGQEIASQVVPYPSGEEGVFLDPLDPNVARQNAEDYLFSMKESVRRAIDWAKDVDSSFESTRIIGIGIDTTGSSPMPVNEVINCGGLAAKNPFLLQIYADITGRPMKVSQSDQTCALGAAIFGAVAAGPEQGGFSTVEEAQQAVTGIREIYFPDKTNHAVYRDMFKLYCQLHDAFGTSSWSGSPSFVMKDLIALREAQRDRRINA